MCPERSVTCVAGCTQTDLPSIASPTKTQTAGATVCACGLFMQLCVIALAVTANLKVSDIVESLLVHPALAEALAEAAE